MNPQIGVDDALTLRVMDRASLLSLLATLLLERSSLGDIKRALLSPIQPQAQIPRQDGWAGSWVPAPAHPHAELAFLPTEQEGNNQETPWHCVGKLQQSL